VADEIHTAIPSGAFLITAMTRRSARAQQRQHSARDINPRLRLTRVSIDGTSLTKQSAVGTMKRRAAIVRIVAHWEYRTDLLGRST
jgi:hypothetical protein